MAKQQDLNIIHSMVSSNTFPFPPAKQPCANPSQENRYSYKPKQKCATFTNVGKETTFITKIFRKTNLTVTFKTYNAIEYNLRAKQKCMHNNNNNSNILLVVFINLHVWTVARRMLARQVKFH